MNKAKLLKLPTVVQVIENQQILVRSRFAAVPFRQVSFTPDFIKDINVGALHQKVLSKLQGTLPLLASPIKRRRIARQISPPAPSHIRHSSLPKSKKSTLKSSGQKLLKNQIVQSHSRVKNLKAGKPLQQVFELQEKPFIAPPKSRYNRFHLGTPKKPPSELQYSGRNRQLSFVDSKVHGPLVRLPSLREVVKKTLSSKTSLYDQDDLEYKLDRCLVKPQIRKSSIIDDALHKIKNWKPNIFQVNKQTVSGPVQSLHERYVEFQSKKEKLNQKLRETLATLDYDRPSAIKWKHKNFDYSPIRSTVSIWNMRLKAEKERMEKYKATGPYIDWYRELLQFTIQQCNDISPATYYILDYIRQLIAQAIPFTKQDIEKVLKHVTLKERTKGVRALIMKILSNFE